MTHHLSALAQGKLILILEGGYNLNAISLSMTLCTKALLGDPLPPLAPYKPPLPSAVEAIRKVIKVHSKHWSFIKAFNCSFPLTKEIPVHIKLESDSPIKLEEREKEQTSEVDGDLLYDLTIDNRLKPPPSKNLDIDIDDQFVKDTEYIPEEFGASATTAGINTISSLTKLEPRINHTVIDSQDYVSAQKLYCESKNKDVQNVSLSEQFEKLKLTSSQQQAVSMPDLPSTEEYNFNLELSHQTQCYQEDYIPFQYGSYPKSGSIYTFTKSRSSSTSTQENTATTDSTNPQQISVLKTNN